MSAASCDAEVIVGIIGHHDSESGTGGSSGAVGSGGHGTGGFVSSSGGRGIAGSGGSLSSASGGRGPVGTGGAAGSKATVPDVGICAPLYPALEGTNRCGNMFGIAFSPDGKMLAAGKNAATPNVRLWSLPSGAALPDIEGFGDATYSVAFSPDGRWLATAGDLGSGTLAAITPGIVKIWDLSAGSSVASAALVTELPATCGIYADSVTFSHDGKLLATAGYAGPIELWRVSDWSRVASMPYPQTVHNVHFSPDDTQLIAGGFDMRATIWSVPAGTLLYTLEGTGNEMADADFSPSGKTIATTGVDNLVKIWDAATHTLQLAMPGHNAYVSHVVWIDEDRLVSDDWSGVVNLWVRAGQGFMVSKQWTLDGQALGIAVAPDKSRLAIAGSFGITFLTL